MGSFFHFLPQQKWGYNLQQITQKRDNQPLELSQRFNGKLLNYLVGYKSNFWRWI